MKTHAAQTWAERARAELGASQRFRELLNQLTAVNADPHVIRLVHEAEQDEDRHALLCARMAIKLGHDTGFADSADLSPSHHYSWAERSCEVERTLADVVFMCCITESMNASLLNTIYEHARESEAGSLIHEILKDEVKHAQIGWAYLNAEHQRRDCRFISDYLVEMFNLAVRDEIFLPVSDDTDDLLYTYGVMPPRLRLRQFQDTLTQVICPGLERFAIDTQPLLNWLETRLTPSVH